MFSKRFEDVNIVARSRTPALRATRCMCSLRIGVDAPQNKASSAAGAVVLARALGSTAGSPDADSQLLKLTSETRSGSKRGAASSVCIDRETMAADTTEFESSIASINVVGFTKLDST
jgi:hypothetical protein